MISSPADIAESALADLDPTLSRDQEDSIIEHLADASRSLRDIAEHHGLTVAALSLWSAQPRIQERLAAFESLLARQIRITATNNLSTAIASLTETLEAAHAEEAQAPFDPANPKLVDQRRRARSAATQAARLLHRIAQLGLTPNRATKPTTAPSDHKRSAPTRGNATRASAPVDEPTEAPQTAAPTFPDRPDEDQTACDSLTSTAPESQPRSHQPREQLAAAAPAPHSHTSLSSCGPPHPVVA